MKKRKLFAVIMLATVLFTQSACTMQSSSQSEAKSKTSAGVSEKTIMSEYERILKEENMNLKDVAAFVENNIKFVSPENGSELIIGFEDLQKINLPNVEQEFFVNSVQEKLQQQADPNLAEDIKDSNLKALISRTRESGYKVETAEGMYFPVIDYTFYETFTPFATEDIRSYISFMDTESAKPPAKDAALIISFDEVLSRAQVLERFMDAYPDSKRSNQISELMEKYKSFTFFGANNTPLFDYTSKQINADAQKAYETAIIDNTNSAFLNSLKGFMAVVAKNGYKLTDEVEQYRSKLVKG